MSHEYEQIIVKNDTLMIFRGTFFGQPIYTPAKSLSSYVPPPTTDPQATVCELPKN
jgi:hypothetical protein